jgi:hypothetical protein
MPNREYQNAVHIDGLTDHHPVDSYTAGQLGSVLTIKDTDGVAKRGQVVQYDSIATVAAADGSVAWWVNRAKYLVSVDIGASARGNRAGIIRSAALVNEVCVVQQGGKCSVQFIDSPTAAPTTAGLIVIPSDTSAKADCLAAGSSATYPALGTSAGTATAHYADVVLDIEPNVP